MTPLEEFLSREQALQQAKKLRQAADALEDLCRNPEDSVSAVVRSFLEEHTSRTDRVRQKDLYQAFAAAAQGGKDYPISARAFNKQLNPVFHSRQCRGLKHWMGLSLKTDAPIANHEEE